jgi:hypothetical protein
MLLCGNRADADHGQIRRQGIEHYRRELAAETDETKREALARLLAEEEAQLASLMNEKRFHDG